MYIWIAIGEASGLPVFAAHKKYTMITWLRTRRSVHRVRLFRSGGPNGIIEVCAPCMMDRPNQPVREKNHD